MQCPLPLPGSTEIPSRAKQCQTMVDVGDDISPHADYYNWGRGGMCTASAQSGALVCALPVTQFEFNECAMQRLYPPISTQSVEISHAAINNKDVLAGFPSYTL